jgi:hypothetical protein
LRHGWLDLGFGNNAIPATERDPRPVRPAGILAVSLMGPAWAVKRIAAIECTLLWGFAGAIA